jgi:hypothetical protein
VPSWRPESGEELREGRETRRKIIWVNVSKISHCQRTAKAVLCSCL